MSGRSARSNEAEARWDEAIQHFRRGAAAAWANDNPAFGVELGMHEGVALARAGRVDEAITLLDRLLEQAADFPHARASAALFLSWVLHTTDPDRAERIGRQELATAEATGNAWALAAASCDVAIAELRRDNHAAAADQTVRDDGPSTHLPKAGTPTMGGALILLAILVSTLLWANLSNRFVWLVLVVTLAFGVIGFVDDYRKLVLGNAKGLAASRKFFWQSVVGIGAAVVLWVSAEDPTVEHALLIPYLPAVLVPLSVFVYVPLAFLVIVGTSNAVNLTDGLDGLAIMPAVLVGSALGIFSYAAGNVVFSAYLGIPYVSGSGEMLVFVRPWLAPAWASCGSTPTPRRSSWATSAHWRSVPL